MFARLARRLLGAQNARLLHRLIIESAWPHRDGYLLAGVLMLIVPGMFAAVALLMRDVFNAVFIAHRLATIRRAGKIAVVDRGRVVEEGTHDYLVGQRGLCARLADLQFGSQGETA